MEELIGVAQNSSNKEIELFFIEGRKEALSVGIIPLQCSPAFPVSFDRKGAGI